MKIISKFIVCFLNRYNNINIVYTRDKTLVIIRRTKWKSMQKYCDASQPKKKKITTKS